MCSAAEKIERNGKVLAVIVRSNFVNQMEVENKKIHFVSPEDFPLQVGLHYREKEENIEPHTHLPFENIDKLAVQEFFYIISGSISVNIYDDYDNDIFVRNVILKQGDSIIMNSGHSFKFLEETKLIELKQGPYRGREKEKRTLKTNFVNFTDKIKEGLD